MSGESGRGLSDEDEGFDACPEPTCPLYGKAVMADHRHLDTPAARCRREAEGRVQSPCSPCEDPQGHQYDDDRNAYLYGFPDGPWSHVGDPCIWCDHEKCEACPPPRGETFAEAHAAGREDCWNEECPRCGDKARAENERVRGAIAALQEEVGNA